LNLGEMRLLPLEDIHLIFTVHERVQTARIKATAKDVSRHIQPLIAASVKAFTPTPYTDVIATLPDEHPSALISSPSFSPTIAHNIAFAETLVEVDDSPTDTDFSPESMRKDLEETAYDRAVASISSPNSEEASCVIVKWANDCCKAWPSETYPLRDLIYAFAYRCAREASFSGTAADVLVGCKSGGESQGKIFRDSSGTKYHGLGDCLQRELYHVSILILQTDSQSSCDPSRLLGKVLYGRMERWLTDTDFASRLNNCIAFVGKALMMGLISKPEVLEALKCVPGHALYYRLLVLGRQLESYPAGLDDMFKELDARCHLEFSRGSKRSDVHRKSFAVSINLSLFVKLSQHRTKSRCRKY
jgi:hypothetical protein